MARYTRDMLRDDLAGINTRAAAFGRNTYLVAEGRNGYTGLDEYSHINNRCIRTIKAGTPTECLNAAMNWGVLDANDVLEMFARLAEKKLEQGEMNSSDSVGNPYTRGAGSAQKVIHDEIMEILLHFGYKKG